MVIEVNISKDVLENKDDITAYLKTIITDNLTLILNSIDGKEISAQLGFDSDRKWNEFVTEMKDGINKSIEKNATILVKEDKEEAPAETTPAEVVESLSFLARLEKYANEV
jgi:hypothetical protein